MCEQSLEQQNPSDARPRAGQDSQLSILGQLGDSAASNAAWSGRRGAQGPQDGPLDMKSMFSNSLASELGMDNGDAGASHGHAHAHDRHSGASDGHAAGEDGGARHGRAHGKDGGARHGTCGKDAVNNDSASQGDASQGDTSQGDGASGGTGGKDAGGAAGGTGETTSAGDTPVVGGASSDTPPVVVGGDQTVIGNDGPAVPNDGSIPPGAAAAGYTMQTFGGPPTIGGSEWSLYNQNGVNPAEINATQNPDGSVTIAGGGDKYNAQMMSNKQFGGGMYAEATLSFTGATSGLWSPDSSGWPAFWGDANVNNRPGGDHVETDFMEIMDGYGGALHRWGDNNNIHEVTGPNAQLPPGTDLNAPHTYGFLWVPATDTTQGKAEWYFDNKPVGQPVTWANGDQTYGKLDQTQIQLLMGSGPNSPMTVSDVRVFQASDAYNAPV